MQNDAAALGATARAFHWATAALVVPTIPAGLIMVRDGIPRGLQDALFLYHKNAGVLILILVLARLFWRARHAPPPLPAHLPRWQAMAATLNHVALYALLLVLPVTGYIRVRAGGFPIEVLDALGVPALVPRSEALATGAQWIHWAAGLTVTAAVLMHLGAAAYHGLIRRDGIIGRIWPPVGPARAGR